MQQLVKIFFVSATFLSLLSPFSAFSAPSAVNKFINSADKTAVNSGLATEDQTRQEDLFQKITGGFINGILNILGVIFLLLIIYGGILWMTASGNENKITKAKGIIFHSMIGLAIILLAKVIALLVIDIILPDEIETFEEPPSD